ncbi:ribonuclease inhibitor-like [Brachyhypopomus gauderio]|uniref:ribonuclease inhibitor-like n=1 Tax=Brachyhypopomus gauderio TaxID=698409 RepID=UPI00404242B0
MFITRLPVGERILDCYKLKMPRTKASLRSKAAKKRMAERVDVPPRKKKACNDEQMPEIHHDENTRSLMMPVECPQKSTVRGSFHQALPSLSKNNVRDEGYAALCSAMRSNPSSRLRELRLSYNKPGYSGVKQLSALLEDPHCKLEKLDLSNCNIREEGCAALCSALRSNPSSHLRELNLNDNEPGDSGVKQLCDLLEDPNCKLEKLQ